MFKKILLFVTTLAVAIVAYMAYTWRESAIRPREAETVQSAPLRQPRSPSTQAADGASAPGFELKGAVIPPGESPKVVVLDPKGNAKIIFQSLSWKPISETGFHVKEPNARVLLPGGQLAYVWADEGEVELQRREGNNFTPRKGKLVGHVRIFIDRSKPEWREANRDWVEPEKHPEMIVKMWLEEVEFDMDLGRIESHGPITVQSSDGSLEGRGLELIWNEANRQVRLLRIEEGRRAIIKTSGLVGFAGGSVKEAMQGPVDAPGDDANGSAAKARAAKAAQKRRPATQPAKPKTDDQRFEFHTLDDKDTVKPPTDRVDAYDIEFKGNVVAEQKDGANVAGQLKADMLQLIAEIGRDERAAVEHVPEKQTGGSEESAPSAEQSERAAAAMPRQPGQPKPDRRTTVEVRWTGELVATPVLGERSAKQKKANGTQAQSKPEGESPSQKAEHFHVVATGSPVEIFDRESGGGTCQKLEYHAETKRLWLIGNRENMVTMNAGADRQLMGEKIFFDRQTGIARVEGAGRMIDQHRKESEKLPACMGVADAGLSADEPTANSDISWTGSVQIEFGVLTTQPATPVASGSSGLASADKAAGLSEAAKSAGQGAQKKMSALGYLRRAVFDGQVVVKQQDDSISADRVEARFMPPRPGGDSGKLDRSTAAEMIIATGNVHMTRGTGGGAAKRATSRPGFAAAREKMVDDIRCERLEVEMTIDDTGRNVPRVGHAFGKVDAMRISGDMQREIHAADGLVLQLASVPRPITPEERARFEAGAARCGFAPGSPEWQAFEKRLQSRRKMVATNLIANQDVRVQMRNARNPEKNLDLVAQALDCTLREDEDITRAIIVGTTESPASVDLGDVYVKGPRISLDMDAESLEVPGAGSMRFVSKQDLTGRAAENPVPVVVSWEKRMSLRGKENTGIFSGGISAASATTTLNAAELRIEFENLPGIQQAATAAQDGWVFRPLLNAVAGSRQKDDSPTARMGRQMRKRASYLRASGDAVIVSTQYAKAQVGLLTRVTDTMLPASVKTQMSKAAARNNKKAATQPADARQIVSRFRVAGPLIGINLAEEHFDVQGPGNLLIEDRRLPQPGRATAAGTADESLLTSAVGPLDNAGPSQTLFQWQNAMSFANKRNTAVFEKGVLMDHVSGAKMAYSEELAAAMKLDAERLQHIRSRQAHLGCEHMLVEFDRRKGASLAEGTPLSEVTQLKLFQATGKVLLELEGGQQSASGNMMSYNAGTGDVRIVGSPEAPAQVMEQDERTGKLNLVRADRGNELQWNQRTGTIHMTGANITATGR